MLDHEQRPAEVLAHGPAKPDDIERVRRDVETAKDRVAPERPVERAVADIEAACHTIREDLSHIREATRPAGRA